MLVCLFVFLNFIFPASVFWHFVLMMMSSLNPRLVKKVLAELVAGRGGIGDNCGTNKTF